MVNILILIVLIIVAIGVLNSLLSAAFGIVGIALAILSWMLAGYLAGKLLRGRGYGPVGDTALGLAGGIVGSIFFSVLGLGGVGSIPVIGSIIVGAFGAVILVFLIRLLAQSDFAK